MHFRPSNNPREAYSEAMRELSTHGEEPEPLPRLDPAADRRRYPEGFYGERNWEWDGAQRGPFSGKGPRATSARTTASARTPAKLSIGPAISTRPT